MGTHPIFESDFDCLTDKSETMAEVMAKHFLRIEIGEVVDAFKSDIKEVNHFAVGVLHLPNSGSTTSIEDHCQKDNELSMGFDQLPSSLFPTSIMELSPKT